MHVWNGYHMECVHCYTGNEGYGVRKELSRHCTALLTIPPIRHLPPGFDSLNVSVAAGIVLHRLQTTAHCTNSMPSPVDQLHVHSTT